MDVKSESYLSKALPDVCSLRGWREKMPRQTVVLFAVVPRTLGAAVGFKELKLWVFTVARHEKQLQRDAGDKTTAFHFAGAIGVGPLFCVW